MGLTIMLVMAKIPGTKNKPVAVRLDEALIEQVRAIGERAPFKPTFTQLIEAALREYVERHGQQPPRKPK